MWAAFLAVPFGHHRIRPPRVFFPPCCRFPLTGPWTVPNATMAKPSQFFLSTTGDPSSFLLWQLGAPCPALARLLDTVAFFTAALIPSLLPVVVFSVFSFPDCTPCSRQNAHGGGFLFLTLSFRQFCCYRELTHWLAGRGDALVGFPPAHFPNSWVAAPFPPAQNRLFCS